MDAQYKHIRKNAAFFTLEYYIIKEEKTAGFGIYADEDVYGAGFGAYRTAESGAYRAVECDAARGGAYERASGGAYGVGVKKFEDGVCEDAYFNAVTCNAEDAASLIKLLADNSVTPCCLRDVLEDLLAV